MRGTNKIWVKSLHARGGHVQRFSETLKGWTMTSEDWKPLFGGCPQCCWLLAKCDEMKLGWLSQRIAAQRCMFLSFGTGHLSLFRMPTDSCGKSPQTFEEGSSVVGCWWSQ
ncbi:hypothetical protein AMTRI_Chr04g190510 [Amborella trichopoda]